MTTAPVMTIAEELLDELEEKAKAATPGPWHIYCDDVIENHEDEFVVDVLSSTDDDAAHIAAANPSTLLALIAHIRSLEARLKNAEKNAARYQWLLTEAWFQEAFDRFSPDDGGLLSRFEACAAQIIDRQMSNDPLHFSAIAQEGADHE